MARIKNTDVYNLDEVPTVSDYIIGTDQEDSLRTKNYLIRDLVALITDRSSVGVSNDYWILYLKGDVDTDGSMRIIPDVTNSTEFEFQLRTAGVWNDTGIQIAASTIHLGREVLLSGLGDWLKQTDIDGDVNALLPHHEYEDVTGSLPYPITPILGAFVEKQIFLPDDSVDSGAVNLYQYTGTAPVDRISSAAYFKIGSTAASDYITFNVARENYTSEGGTTIYSRNYPASTFPADTEIRLELEGWLEFEANELVYVEFEVNNGGVFSILHNATNTLPYLALDYYPLSTEDIMTSTTGMDRVLNDLLGDTLSDISGNLILSGLSPSHD